MKQIPDVIDLNAYFQRIGYSGDRSPTLTTLQAIHFCHAKAIAFENLNPLLKQPVLLDLESLQRKLIHERRGATVLSKTCCCGQCCSPLAFK